MPQEGLEAVGIASSSKLREILDEATDVPAAIAQFQAENSLLLPSMKPVLKMLDLHSVRRYDYHERILSELSEKLLQKIKELGSRKSAEDVKKLEIQLDHCFKLSHIGKVRPIVLETLQQLPKVSNKFLKKIVEDPQLYEECNVTVKQQIWVINEKLFIDAITPVLDSYVDDKEKILTAIGRTPTNFFTCDTTKSRRQWKQVKELVKMVGSQPELYRKLMSSIRERFMETQCVHYCSLRLELIMCSHDANVDYILKLDSSHDLAWCLDACVRDRHLDIQQSTKLKALLDKRKISAESLADMAMIAADPHVVHFLCEIAVKCISENARNCEGMPRENPILYVVVRLLYLGLSAYRIIKENVSDMKQIVDVECLTRFMPLLSQIAAEDFIRLDILRAPDEISDEFLPDYEVGTPSSAFTGFIKSDNVCAILWLHYLLHSLPTKKRPHPKEVLDRNLRLICKSKEKIAVKEPWAHLIAHSLTQPNVDLKITEEETAKAVFHDLFIRGISQNENCRFHLLRFIVAFKNQLSEEVISKIIAAVTPNPDGAAAQPSASSRRFERDLQRVTNSISNQQTSHGSALSENSETRAIGESSVNLASNDLLSAMQFDGVMSSETSNNVDYAQAVAVLKEGYKSGVNQSIANRKKNLGALKDLLTENEGDIADAVYADLRKCKFEVVAHETGNVIGEIESAIANLKGWTKPTTVTRYILQATDSAYTVKEPLGTVLIAGAWNFPIQLLLSPLVGALAAGNTVLLKPSELAPATEKLLLELFPKYFDEGVVKVVHADHEQMKEILQIPFDHIFFTGSSAVGKIIMRYAAEHLTPVTLELGGKSPSIIDTDADLSLAARRLCWGKFLNTGQVCVAPDYALIVGDDERRQQFSAECRKSVLEFYGEKPEASDDYGRIINWSHFDRLDSILKATSGKIVTGGVETADRDSKFIPPTIIEVEENDETMKEEIFGPILPILKFPTLDEAINSIRRRPKPLVTYLFSDQKTTIDRILTETSQGTLTINDTIMHMSLDNLPFGGVGNSGMGRYHGKSSFDTFSHEKSVLHRSSGFEKLLWMRYPPFTADKLTWAKRFTMKIRLPF